MGSDSACLTWTSVIGSIREVSIVIADQFAMELVSTAAGDDIDDSSHRTAMLSFVSTRFDLNFIDKLKNNLLGRITGV